MKVAAAILYALALVAALTIAPYAEGKWIIRKVSAGTSYIVDEDFEGTGAPSLWTTDNTVNFDDTTYGTNLVSQTATISTVSTKLTYTFASSYADLWVAFMFEVNATSLSAASIAGIRDVSEGGLSVLIKDASNNLQFFAGGATQTTSSSFALTNDTRYHGWIRYSTNGTAGVYVSTTTTRPTAPADTATTFAHEYTVSSGANAKILQFRSPNSTNHLSVDEVFASTTEITNPW